jgi:glycosyltransferase involved in cell wall biosynthesis
MNTITVVIPALNEEKFLPQLLKSLTEQTRKDFGVVVVDGSSKDRTVELARSFSPQLADLQVIVSQQASLPLQRNLGARAASTEWLVFLDSDITVQPYFIERIEDYITDRQPQIFTAWCRPDSEVSGDALFILVVNLFVEGSVVVHRPIAPGPLVVVRREVFDQAGGYDETLTFGEDYDFTQRVTALGIQLQILRETLYAYSLRRVRKIGKLRFVGLYAKASFLVLFTRRNLKNVPTYVMGGHFYEDETGSTQQPAPAQK